MKTTAYPSHVIEGPFGLALVASETVEEGVVVERLEGRIVPYNKIPETELRNAFEVDDDRWIVPNSPAKHIDHSCDPNCYISTNLDIIALRMIHKGEPLT